MRKIQINSVRAAKGFRSAARVAVISCVAFSVALVAACDGVSRLLEVQTPSQLAEDPYLVPQNAALISASAVADYECALGAYIVVSGLASGELVDGSQTAARWSYDRRAVLASDATYSTSSCENIGVYTPINTARYTNDQAVRVLEGWTDAQVPNRQRLIATNAAMAGFSLLLLGEGFCEGVINVGPSQTPAQLFDSAEVRFTKALAAATTAADQNLINLARVGRARARINRGATAGAIADASSVPLAFVYNASADLNSARRNNRIFAQNNTNFAVTVAPAYRTLTVAGNADPRVRVTDGARNTTDNQSRLWVQTKYTSLTANTPIATGVEAQLILAEAQGAGQGVATLNAIRARAGIALPALTNAEVAAFTTTLVEERRRELYLQGNRWFDVKRFNLTLEPATGAVYPAGATAAKGGVYADQRCWPLPDAEKLANPNFGN